MTKYYAMIDGGEGGDTTLEATSMQDAMAQAIEWAKDGDWPEEGCDIRVTVQLRDDDGDVLDEMDETVEIESAEAKEDERLESDGEIIAEDEGEYSTRKIVVIGGQAYYMHRNGGRRGAHDRMCGDGVWRDFPVEQTRELDKSEVRCLMLDWGYDPAKVAAATRSL